MLEAGAEELGEWVERSRLVLRQPVFQIPPEALDGMEFGSVGRKEE
jgi:hypothetical protein